jgi:predicted heme/steroid binding protein
MSKISTYEVAPLPKLSDKLIGTSVGGEIEDATYNFTLQELLDVFLPVIPANNLQGILDYGNTATQDINLFGTITTTNLNVTDTANIYIAYLNEETHIVGSVFDSLDLVGTPGQVLTSTGDGVEWFTLPPIFTPNLEQVLTEGNTSDIDIILDADLEAINITADTANIATQLSIQGTVVDYTESAGTAGQVLESTVTGVQWTNLPVYSATSPLLFNSGTNTFSIQVANSTQGGYLTANDWVTFDGKQNAGAYITALTGEATATGPGSVPITLNNASVIAKVLTGLNVAGGSISASDSILTAFGKVQSQINSLMGGVQYQGVWNADINAPTLTSSVGTQGYYYIVNVAGSTNLNGITDWKVGDWAIFSGGTWQKVDNTESVTSVNGQVGAVSLTTDDIPEGSTNLYYLNSRARASLSFAAGSGAYNSLTGVITIPTDNNQILNGAGYITLASLSATAPLSYNALTGAFSIPQATTLVDGYLSAIDWTTFNNKQNYLGGTGLVKSTAGTITYITDNSGNWNTAYDRSIISASVTGTTTKTLTLNEQDGGTITASWTDLDTGLTSVGVSMPSAFSVANSPLTSNGTIAVTGAGTSLQYIDGTGALQTFPGLTGFVPYTGATTNVDLGTFGLISDYLRLNITPSSIPTTVGTMSWNNSDGTMDIRLKGGNVTLQVGEETVVRVVNKSGVDLLEANYQVVRVRNEAEGGAQGQRLAVVLARANTKVNHTGLLGIVTETINSNQEGFVTNFGIVRDIDTTGDLQGETWADGDVLWLSETTAGALTNVEPTTHPVQIGYVTYAHANNGKIFVYLQEGVDELDELHDVNIVDVANNDGIFYNSTTSFWENKTIAEVLGYTPANAATNIATTAPLQGGGDLSANRTFSITQSGAASDGYLSSIDWNTFNNKQPAGSYVPTSRLLSINGTQYDLSADRSWSVGTVTSVAALTLGTSGTDLSSSVANGTTTPVITLNVPTASAANRGALSAADWSTFNTKVGSVTASSPLASSGGSTPNITIQQASGSQDGYLSSTDWTTFNNKQAAGNYITSLTGEATATGPGAAAVTLNNASVTAKVLTGINITGGTVQATDTMLTAFGKLQNQINGLIGSTIYQGTWNASTNTPALASGVGVRGYYYIVSVAGNTNLDGITDWFIGDWAIFDGTAWQQVDNTDAVVSVNGFTGAVSLTTDNIPEGTTNQYYLNSRARAALSFVAGSGAYNSTTGVITIPTNNNQITNGANYITLASLSGTAPIVYSNTTGAISITQAGTASNGYLSSTDWNTFNNKQSALTNPVTGTGTANEITYWTGTSTIGSLSTATYPSLTELSYVKGVTSAIQTQVNSKAPNNGSFGDANAPTIGGFFSGYNPTNIPSGQSSGDWGLLNAPMYPSNNASERYTFQFAANLDNNANIFIRKFRYNGAILQDTWYTLLNNSNGVTLDTAQTITGKKTFSNAFGDSDPIVAFTGTSIGTFQYATTAYNSGLSTGQTIAHFIGKAGSSRGSSYIGYQFASADSNSNFLTLGIWGYDHLLKIYPTGAATLSGAFTSSIAALSTASNAFVVSDSGTLKYRTAAQVLSDIGGQVSGNYVTLDTTQTITGQKTISRASSAYAGTTQSFLIDGAAGDGSLTINSITTGYAYTTFAQNQVGKFEIGIVGTGGNGSFYINRNIQTGEVGASIYIKKTDGFVGILNLAPTVALDVTGAGLFSSSVTASSLIKNGGTSSQFLKADGSVDSNTYLTSGFVTIGTLSARVGFTTYRDHNVSAVNDAPIKSLSNTEDNWIYLDAANAQYGIYHRNIDTPLVVSGVPTLPGNSIAFIGANSVQAYICFDDGSVFGKSFVKNNGTSSQFLKADGSVDSNTYATTTQLGNYLPLTGGTLTGRLTINLSNNYGVVLNRPAITNYIGIVYQTAAVNQWFIGLRELSTNHYYIYNETLATNALTINVSNNNATFGGTLSASNLSGTNTGDQTLSGLGGVPTSRTLTINGTAYDLSADRTWSVGTVLGNANILSDANAANVTINGGFYTGFNPTNIPAGQSSGDWGLMTFPMWTGNSSGERYAVQLAANLDDNGSIFIRKFKFYGTVSLSTWYTLATTGNTVTLNTTQTITGKKTFSNAFGDNDPVIALTGTASSSFQYITTAYNPSIGTDQTIAHFIGRSSSNKNSAYFGYQWRANSSDQNFISLGHYMNDHIFRVYASGRSVLNATAASLLDYAGPVQSFMINGGAGDGALTINSSTTGYAYVNFAQGLTSKFEIGIVGTGGNGSFYINRNIQTGETGASVYINKSNGFVGILANNPAYTLDVGGDIRSGRLRNIGSLGLSSYQTVNPASNVFLYSTPNDRDMWVMLDSADTGSNWGIYYRQIDTPLVIGGQATLPANSVAWVGGGNSGLRAYICLADGTAYHSGSLTASSFFEISDSRLKKVVKNDYKAIGIENIKSRLYIKNGREELGYFAQDFAEILPSAIAEAYDGFLTLSYTQVHTAKIAIIEDEVTILKRRVAELESKLQA